MAWTAEDEARIRAFAAQSSANYLRPHADICAMLGEIDRLRALVPTEAEREALAKLRELRASKCVDALRFALLVDAAAFALGAALRSAEGDEEERARDLRALAALLAPEGEVAGG